MGNLLILGAGGHGRVVAETAELQGTWENIMLLDDREDVDTVLNHRIIGKLNEYERFVCKYEYAVVCIGDNEKRLDLIAELRATEEWKAASDLEEEKTLIENY